MKNFTKILKLTLFLSIVAGLSGAALSTVYQMTNPIIQQAQAESEKENLMIIYDNDEEFNTIDEGLDDYDLLESCYKVEKDDQVEGYVYKVNVNGYGGTITYLLAFDSDGTYKGFQVIDCSSETKGFGSRVGDDEFKNTIVGKDIGSSIDTLSGATISSTAVIKGINQANEHYNQYLR